MGETVNLLILCVGIIFNTLAIVTMNRRIKALEERAR